MQKLNLGEDYNQVTAQPEPAVTTAAAASPVQTQASTSASVTQKGQSMPRSNKKLPLILAIVAISLGALTGMGASRLTAKSGINPIGGTKEPMSQVASGTVNVGDVFGVQDEKTFKDSAEGYLEIGGLDGEGSHKLLRPGGDSQTVYLTSSVTDLDKFDGMSVKVWGETFKGQKAGWLMDVGRVQIVSPQGEKPTEE
jgi:hypothetical protein